MRTSKAILLALAGVFPFAAPAAAHDLWLEKTGGGLVLYHGHPPGLGHDDSKPEKMPVQFIRKAVCYDDRGIGAARDSVAAYPIECGDGAVAATVLVSTGYWSKTPYGTRNVPKTEAPGAVSSWLSYESVKRLERWTDAFARPLTEDLEVAPLNDPFSVENGGKLRLLVTLAGKPAQGAIVVYDGKPRGETDAGGLVNIKLRHGGTQIVAASTRERIDSEKADEIVRAATLCFVSGAKP